MYDLSPHEECRGIALTEAESFSSAALFETEDGSVEFRMNRRKALVP
jgi:hypothetical protein